MRHVANLSLGRPFGSNSGLKALTLTVPGLFVLIFCRVVFLLENIKLFFFFLFFPAIHWLPHVPHNLFLLISCLSPSQLSFHVAEACTALLLPGHAGL